MYEDLSTLEQKYSLHEFPLVIAVEPSNYCNFNCIMCTHDKLSRDKGFMDIRTYKKIIDEVAQENSETRIYLDFYGEPLLSRFNLYYMIDYAKKAGIKNVNTNTNASTLDEEMAEMILDSGIDYISMDCDGYSKEVYESIRVGGDRDTFYKNVEYILKRKRERGLSKPIIEVKIIEMEQNKDEVETVMKYWQSMGAWTAKRRMHSWGGSNKLSELKDIGFRIACGKSVGVCGITWDGNVTNCTADADATVVWGNVNKESIKEIWARRNEKMVKLQLDHRFDELPLICQGCNDWQIVGEERFDENGNPIQKNYKERGKTFA